MVQKLFVTVFGAAFLLTAGIVYADWNPGDDHKMHFPQLPDEQGWDVDATQPIVLADDWRCSETGLVEDIHFWGSWRDMSGDRVGDVGQIVSFVLSIHADIPVSQNPDGYSKPGETLWEAEIHDWVAVPIDPPTMEHWLDPSHEPDEVVYNDHDAYFQYNIDLTQITDIPPLYEQIAGTIYWLNISAILVDNQNYRWGWKSSIDHWNDDAVWANWGDLGWIDIIEPPRYNEFNATYNADGTWGGGGGTNYYGDGWYYYDPVAVGDNPWYNIWFYDNPFSYDNDKIAKIQGFVWPVTTGENSEIIIAVNWSTDLWSQEGTQGQPPLPGVNQSLMIGRQIIWQFNGIIEGGEMPFTGVWEFLEYNPEWISIDVWGTNFGFSGAITHECVTTSLDLAFVITGGEEPILGACCWDDGTCTDPISQFDCENPPGGIPGTYMGDGFTCSGDGNSNGVDDLCEGVVDMGACCYGDPHQPSCVNTTATVCGQTYNGTWYAGEDCDNPAFVCPVPQGACCYGDPVQCINTGKVDCENNLLGTWYAGEDCATFECPTTHGELKWEQLPDLEVGDDVTCSYHPGSQYPPYLLAADFPCEQTGPITEIHVFGSWYLDNLPYGVPGNVSFILSIHEDIPADQSPTEYSMPGELICLIEDPLFAVQLYADELQEGWLEPPDYWTPYPQGDAICWEYVFNVEDYDCIQKGTEAAPKVYWLDVQAYPDDVEAWFGWKTSMPPWNDDACFAFAVDDAGGGQIEWGELRFPPNHEYYPNQSADLAFAIYGIEGQPQIGACCYENGDCADGMTQADCEASGGDYGSDGSQCAGVDTDLNGVDDFCDDIVTLGACCYGNPISPSCINTTQYLCELAGGGYAGTWYADQDCATFTCPVAGACCYEDAASGWTCIITPDAATCESLTNGTWYEGVDCASIDCPDLLTGACCYGDPADPTCVNTTQALCQSQYNGTWYSGEDCATFTCPTTPTAACCYGPPVAAMQCINTTQALCQSQYNGIWYSGEDCATFTCPTEPTGACCLEGGTICQPLTAADCQSAGGKYKGDGTVCLSDNDGNGYDDACEDKILKWEQPPDLLPTGMDVYGMDELVLASDFLCQTTGPIKEIHVWGSWQNDEFPDHPGEVAFTLSFHMDIPADQSPTGYSVPGELICRLYDFMPGEFEVREWPTPGEEGEGWYNPVQQYYEYPGDFMIWEYIFTLPDDYLQLCYQEGTDEAPVVYWLDVQARSIVGASPFFWGWKTTPLEMHWNDNSVWSFHPEPVVDPHEWMELYYPPDHIAYPQEPLDLAFAIYNETPCCIGRVGNANGLGTDEPTIGDVSVMIDALFISGDINVIACLPEADINQSGGPSVYPGDITIGDISLLINYLFITGPSLGLSDCL